MMATPRVEESALTVARTPKAVPAFVGGIALIAEEYEGVKISGTPTPKAKNTMRRIQSASSTKKAAEKKEKMRSKKPRTTGIFAPDLSAIHPPIGEIKRTGKEVTQKTSPLFRGDQSIVSWKNTAL